MTPPVKVNAPRPGPASAAEELEPERAPAPPAEHGYADWRRRLAGNLARRSDGRWDPLTYADVAPAS